MIELTNGKKVECWRANGRYPCWRWNYYFTACTWIERGRTPCIYVLGRECIVKQNGRWNGKELRGHYNQKKELLYTAWDKYLDLSAFETVEDMINALCDFFLLNRAEYPSNKVCEPYQNDTYMRQLERLADGLIADEVVLNACKKKKKKGLWESIEIAPK